MEIHFLNPFNFVVALLFQRYFRRKSIYQLRNIIITKCLRKKENENLNILKDLDRFLGKDSKSRHIKKKRNEKSEKVFKLLSNSKINENSKRVLEETETALIEESITNSSSTEIPEPGDSATKRNQKLIELLQPSHLKKPLKSDKQDKQLLLEKITELANILEGDKKQIKSELLDAYTNITSEKRNHTYLKDAIGNMAIAPAHEEMREEIFLQDYEFPEEKKKSKKLNSSNKLNIFTQDKTQSAGAQSHLELWNYLEQKHLEYLMTAPPKNYFDELINWTKQGKLWHFPIDNEQGMADRENNIDFSEHVFLDKHLEPWCPKTGPIRHFMELVLVGLSKNYFYTVEEKIEHIMWFKTYFENKQKMLEDLRVLEPVTEVQVQT